MAFLSKQLATLNVDIDLSQLTAQQMECHGTYEDHFTPEFLEFLEKNEFSSLIPKGMENGVEEELEFEELAVDDDKKLEKVLDLLRAKTSLTLRTVGTRTVLGKLFLAFDTTTVYEIDARNADYLRKIIELLLERKDHIRVV